MPLYRVTLDWTIPSGNTANTILHFTDAVPIQSTVDALRSGLTSLGTILTNTTSIHFRDTVDSLNDSTGQLEGVVAVAAPASVAGSATGSPVADASQGLIRMSTNAFLNGRRVQGRMFVPGIASSALVGGNLAASAVGDLADALAPTVGALCVFSRPTPTRGGSVSIVNALTGWSELAVLRRRRNR